MATQARIPQRLVLCLDGTWNTRDSGTNVYHLSNLIQDDGSNVGADGWRQRVYYDEGVGTGLLDSVTGGAFGIGVSLNVREAYDWLVEQYDDGDEIYVFGFSRGAFTARSLVGLVARCGLVRRGAPLPPDEIWRAYQILGGYGNAVAGTVRAKSLRERLTRRTPRPFRSIWTLRRDRWEPRQDPPPRSPQNRAEELLRTWSRRVRIHCIGVFDTVGSLGVDALAIPWLRERVAQFHDTHLSTVIVNAFQALAIDEHRANFTHIPWHADPGATKTGLGGEVEQRWFLGAHSNVGGGYPHEVLARIPLAWMIAKSRALGLVFKPSDAAALAPPAPSECVPLLQRARRHGDPAPTGPTLRDSYSDFAGGFWRHVVRSKRSYREIAPPPILLDGKPAQSANEVVDPSVEELLEKDPGEPRHDPPNLWAHRNRKSPGASAPPRHRYLEGLGPAAVLVAWLATIGYAGWTVGAFLGGSALGLAIAVLGALLVDFGESLCNHRAALHPGGEAGARRRSWLEALLGLRLFAVGFFFLGAALLAEFAARRLWTWMTTGEPGPHTWRLLALDGLLFLVGGAFAWTGSPMVAAGLGSLVHLHLDRTPDAVLRRLEGFARGATGAEGRNLLVPVARSLWRDLVLLVPCVAVFLACGLSTAASLWTRWSAERSWWIAVGFAAAYAIADVAEDAFHLGFVARYPARPSAAAVATSFGASLVKFLLLGSGWFLSVAALLCLLGIEIAVALRIECGFARAIGISIGILLVAGMVKERIGGRRAPATPIG